MRTGIVAKLLNKFEQIISPATEEKQDEIIAKLQEVADNTDTLELKADQINLNTDEIEAKLDALQNDKALASKQLPDNHNVKVTSLPSGLATEAKQDDIISAINASGSQTLTVRLDEDSSVTYIGKAEAGSNESDAVWQIAKLDETADLELLYADGDTNFDNKWSDRLTLTYN